MEQTQQAHKSAKRKEAIAADSALLTEVEVG